MVGEHVLGDAAKRAAALTNQMLVYSGQGPQLIEAVDISRLVEEMGQLLESSVPGAVLVDGRCRRAHPGGVRPLSIALMTLALVGCDNMVAKPC